METIISPSPAPMSDDQLLALANRGWKLHPLVPNGKVPRLDGWPSEASDDPDRLKRWQGQFPHHNWGIVTGEPSGLVVVDIDPRNGGDKTWASISSGFPQTIAVKTPSGGHHLICR